MSVLMSPPACRRHPADIEGEDQDQYEDQNHCDGSESVFGVPSMQHG